MFLKEHPSKTKADLEEPKWHPLDKISILNPPKNIEPWLKDTTSFTEKVKNIGCLFQIKILAEEWKTAHVSEIQFLNLTKNTPTWIREVDLLCNGETYMFARTIIPHETLEGPGEGLLKLNNSSLGEFLIKSNSFNRAQSEVAKIETSHWLYSIFSPFMSDSTNLLWGRRSLFYYHKFPLLITELFTPTLTKEIL